MPSPVTTPPSIPTVTASTPTTGQTILFLTSSSDQVLYLTPAGTLATLTVTLPSNASSRIGQEVVITCTQIITAITINGAASILNTLTAWVANTSSKFVKVANDTWARIT